MPASRLGDRANLRGFGYNPTNSQNTVARRNGGKRASVAAHKNRQTCEAPVDVVGLPASWTAAVMTMNDNGYHLNAPPAADHVKHDPDHIKHGRNTGKRVSEAVRGNRLAEPSWDAFADTEGRSSKTSPSLLSTGRMGNNGKDCYLHIPPVAYVAEYDIKPRSARSSEAVREHRLTVASWYTFTDVRSLSSKASLSALANGEVPHGYACHLNLPPAPEIFKYDVDHTKRRVPCISNRGQSSNCAENNINKTKYLLWTVGADT
jgi:hypothetical protein